MNIMELGAIGELVGGFAVIGSLIYVGLQVRQSNDHTRQTIDLERNQANRSMTQAMAEVWATLERGEFVELMQRATQSWDGLSSADQGRLGAWLTRFHVNTVSVFLAGQQGLMDEDYCNAWIEAYTMFVASPGLSRWWDFSKPTHHPGFVPRRLAAAG